MDCCRNCVRGVIGVPGPSSELWSVVCMDQNCVCHKLDRIIGILADFSEVVVGIVQDAAVKIVKERT